MKQQIKDLFLKAVELINPHDHIDEYTNFEMFCIFDTKAFELSFQYKVKADYTVTGDGIHERIEHHLRGFNGVELSHFETENLDITEDEVKEAILNE